MRPDDGWEKEPWRAPTLVDGDELIFCEHGRILDAQTDRGVDCRSHWFRVVKSRLGLYLLLVKHGGGEEHIPFGYSRRTVEALHPLSSDARYWLLHEFYRMHRDSREITVRETVTRYQKAFVDGRLKKRKLPARGVVKVWIEPEAAQQSAVAEG
jgi:hypothetical protein